MPAIEENYDVVVVGAGHAGCEAALAAARLGCKTAVFTLSLDAIANMPCNPCIGVKPVKLCSDRIVTLSQGDLHAEPLDFGKNIDKEISQLSESTNHFYAVRVFRRDSDNKTAPSFRIRNRSIGHIFIHAVKRYLRKAFFAFYGIAYAVRYALI